MKKCNAKITDHKNTEKLLSVEEKCFGCQKSLLYGQSGKMVAFMIKMSGIKKRNVLVPISFRKNYQTSKTYAHQKGTAWHEKGNNSKKLPRSEKQSSTQKGS